MKANTSDTVAEILSAFTLKILSRKKRIYFSAITLAWKGMERFLSFPLPFFFFYIFILLGKDTECKCPVYLLARWTATSVSVQQIWHFIQVQHRTHAKSVWHPHHWFSHYNSQKKWSRKDPAKCICISWYLVTSLFSTFKDQIHLCNFSISFSL